MTGKSARGGGGGVRESERGRSKRSARRGETAKLKKGEMSH